MMIVRYPFVMAQDTDSQNDVGNLAPASPTLCEVAYVILELVVSVFDIL
jgi:hypothetical protein